jgi:1,4-alpha-glucan branching enzyme
MRKTEYDSSGLTASSAHLSEIPKPEIERLVSLRHHDPHSILGAHPCSTGVVVRTYHPGAMRVNLLVEGAQSLPMRPRSEAEGLFEVTIRGRPETLLYRLEVLMRARRFIHCDRPIRFLRPWVNSTYIYWENKGTSGRTKNLVRTGVKSVECPASHSRCGHQMLKESVS